MNAQQPGIVKVTVKADGQAPQHFELLTRAPQVAAAEFIKNVPLGGDFSVSAAMTQRGGGFDGPSYDDLVKALFGGMQG